MRPARLAHRSCQPFLPRQCSLLGFSDELMQQIRDKRDHHKNKEKRRRDELKVWASSRAFAATACATQYYMDLHHQRPMSVARLLSLAATRTSFESLPTAAARFCAFDA